MRHNQISRPSRSSPYRPPRRRAGRKRLLGFLGIVIVVVVIVLAVTLTRSGTGEGATRAAAATTQQSSGQTLAGSGLAGGDYTTIPQRVDLLAFRDLSYRPVKGIYVTAYAAASKTKFDGLVKLADETEINAMVIDVKDNSGFVTYNTGSAYAKANGLVDSRIKDIDALIATLNQHSIIPIARLVCFQDSILAKKKPDTAIKDKTTNGNWKDAKGAQYTNPYSREVWEYLVQVAEDAAAHGFREIQFDYVRFPTDGKIANATYPGKDSTKEDAIASFLAFARSRLEKLGVWVSADVFGMTVHAKNDGGFGQKIEKVAASMDIVCPMIYPSHYDKGSYGFDKPNANPYGIVHAAVTEGIDRLAGTGALLRPWLQDFNLGQPPYGATEVKAEIKAAEELGVKEWILWNASNKYTQAALRPN
jgi:hypothetical protein